MTGAVGVIDLRHQVGKRCSCGDLGFERRQAIHQGEMMGCGKLADLIGVLIERILRVVKLGRLIRGRGE